MKPRISVLMGIYNCAGTLREALESLYAQTYQGFKIILCDDGSTDDTYAVAAAEAAKHSNIVLIRNERNMGLNYTLNHCLEHADTEYCARMDGDDVCDPTRFEKEINFLDAHPEYAVVSCPMIYFDEQGDFRWGTGRGEVQAKDFVGGTPICHAPCMMRTDVLRSVGGYSVADNLLRVEDYHLWFKIFAAGHKLYMMDERLYRMRDDRNAVARRNWKTRRNEAYVKWIGYSMIGLPWYYRIFALRSIILYCLPTRLYQVLHQKKMHRKMGNYSKNVKKLIKNSVNF